MMRRDSTFPFTDGSAMPKKKDPSITFLNRFGYNVVKLPRAGIEPMDVIGRDDTTQWLGPIASVWTSSVPVPTPLPPRPAAPVNGQKTDQLQASFGLKILSSTLAAFGATVPALDVAYSRARTVQFSYTNVTSTIVPPLEAGNYLATGTLNSQNPVVMHYFTDEDPQAFLIVDVLKSDSLTITASDERGVEIGLDVPAIQQLVGANVTVKTSGSSTGTITYTGPVPITFGFTVDEIEYDGTRWSLRGAAAGGGLAFATAGGGHGQAGGAGGVVTEAPILLGTGCRVRV
jgi:hypothetical protein